MNLKNHFIKATEEYNTFDKSVPAYYFRRSCCLDKETTAKITVAVCGFYELYLNGEKITKGFLSPYISNPEDYVYYDEYDVMLSKGENVFGILLGNGFQNNPGGHIWDFDKASFRSAPSFSLAVSSHDTILLFSDENFRIAPSPIRSDDYRFGEYYDARYEINGWNKVGFDDTVWEKALLASAPLGNLRAADIYPIKKEKELYPLEIKKLGDSYLYDFGECNAGVCRLTVKGECGQVIELQHADSLIDGDLDLGEVWFVREHWDRDKEIVHKDTYVCRGEGTECYEPSFTYHGFRYVRVRGITEEQATKELLTYLVYHTELSTRGDFECSDAVATKLQEMTRRSILSNFHHFPTDCPQREKNGWTADAALTAEAALLNFDPEVNYREWLANISASQLEDGRIPGIVPTGGWGFHWGNGPAWDSVMVWLPYYTYVYRGRTDMISEIAPTILNYLRYIRARADKKGLIEIGLGDWCQVDGVRPPASPLIVTDSLISMDIARKAEVLFEAVGMEAEAAFARDEAKKYRSAIRENLIDYSTLRVLGNCQSCQAMGIYYGAFDNGEEKKAFSALLEMIREKDGHMDVGVLGGRVIFHVLSSFGESELAFKMITREDYPSYGNWVKCGATTLWEKFQNGGYYSKNHHFWGDISAWFIKCIAGIKMNPTEHNPGEVEISPSFIQSLNSASAYHIAPLGRVSVKWRREGNGVVLELEIPEGMHAVTNLPFGYCFEDGRDSLTVSSGSYHIRRR